MVHTIEKLFYGVIALFVVAIIIGSIGYGFAAYNHEETHEIKVVDKYTKRSDDHDKFYIVVEENRQEEVYENTDLMFKGKFDSADLQAKMKIGKEYEIKTIGYRIPILSKFKVIYSVEEM